MGYLRIALFAWFFMLHAKGGSFAPDIYMMAGPFNSLEDCEDINKWVREDVERVSKCWMGDVTGKACYPAKAKVE